MTNEQQMKILAALTEVEFTEIVLFICSASYVLPFVIVVTFNSFVLGVKRSLFFQVVNTTDVLMKRIYFELSELDRRQKIR